MRECHALAAAHIRTIVVVVVIMAKLARKPLLIAREMLMLTTSKEQQQQEEQEWVSFSFFRVMKMMMNRWAIDRSATHDFR